MLLLILWSYLVVDRAVCVSGARWWVTWINDLIFIASGVRVAFVTGPANAFLAATASEAVSILSTSSGLAELWRRDAAGSCPTILGREESWQVSSIVTKLYFYLWLFPICKYQKSAGMANCKIHHYLGRYSTFSLTQSLRYILALMKKRTKMS